MKIKCIVAQCGGIVTTEFLQTEENILKGKPFPLGEISHVNAYWVENSSDYHFTAINILYGESCKCRKILVFGKQLGRNPTDAQIFLMFYLQKKPKQK